jgi:hypothetical protein
MRVCRSQKVLVFVDMKDEAVMFLQLKVENLKHRAAIIYLHFNQLKCEKLCLLGYTTSTSPVKVSQRFGGTCHLYLQGGVRSNVVG